jgi:hypothetical protein
MRQANAAAAAAMESSWPIRLRIHFKVLRPSSFWRQPVIPVRTARWLLSQRILTSKCCQIWLRDCSRCLPASMLVAARILR